jgi:hypothetical protein
MVMSLEIFTKHIPSPACRAVRRVFDKKRNLNKFIGNFAKCYKHFMREI